MYYDHKNVEFAKALRKEMTPWERKLWYCFLKTYSVRFQRQKTIKCYIADFYCASKKIIIEIDGGQHCDNEKDKARDCYLRTRGFHVLRFWNNDILQNIDGCLEVIKQNLY